MLEIHSSIFNRTNWLWIPVNIKAAKEEAKISVGRSTIVEAFFFFFAERKEGPAGLVYTQKNAPPSQFKPRGVLDIFLGGEVRPGPSNPDPV